MKSLSAASSQVSGHVPTLTSTQLRTVERAAALIVAADEAWTLADYLALDPRSENLHACAFGLCVKLLDQVAIVDGLTGNDGSGLCGYVAGGR